MMSRKVIGRVVRGGSTSPQRPGKRRTWLVICIWLVISTSVIGCSHEETPESSEYRTKVSAWRHAKSVVRQSLKSPRSADFGWEYEQPVDEHVKLQPNGFYKVWGWVDAENAFGGKCGPSS